PILLVDIDPPADARPDDMTVRMIMNVSGNSAEGLEVGARVGIVIEATDPDTKLPFAMIEGTKAGGAQ
ncbi:MAG: hypothetical protein RLZ86_1083, partial [Actinomycetota bacterium]